MYKTTILNNLKELDIYNMLGLIEIAKHNQMFHGHWNFHRKEFNHQFANLLENEMLITIPNMDHKFFKKNTKMIQIVLMMINKKTTILF